MSKFLSERHSGLNAYVPGEQPDDMLYIKLNTNESPYPPPPDVVAALSAAEIQKLNLYPNPDGSALIKKLAEMYGVGPENMILGNGSDELLAFAFLAFCDSKRGVCFPDITYGFYPVYAELYGIPSTQIPLREDFTVNTADYTDVGKNVVIANPNAPTGISLPIRDIEAIAASNPSHVVLVDEAYVDFGAESVVPLTRKYDNLLVVHTFSKSRSLAGARLSYAIGSTALISDLGKMKYSFNPYNINRSTQLAGIAALNNEDYFANNRRNIICTREYTASELKKLGFTVTDSKANFVFVRKPDYSAEMLYKSLKKRGILVRHFNQPRIFDWLRITIGTKDQMDALLGAVKAIIEGV